MKKEQMHLSVNFSIMAFLYHFLAIAISQQQTQQSTSYMQQTPRQQTQQQQSQIQQEPSAAELNLMLSSLGLGLPTNEALQLANWDLKKLAMYLVSNVSENKNTHSLTYSLSNLSLFHLFG